MAYTPIKELMMAHQGLLIVSPEYNSTITPLLKNTIDWASLSGPGEPQLASINTGSDGRDKHLRIPDFFDAANNVEITFKSSRVEIKRVGYVAYGMLTMRGVSKEIALPFELAGPVNPGCGNLIGVSTALTVNWKDYGINWNRVLDIGSVVVGDEVKIEINLEAEQPKG